MKNTVFFFVFLAAFAVVFTACEDPLSPVASGTNFNVSNEAEWNAAISDINRSGNDREYTITVIDDFSVAGNSSDWSDPIYTFNPAGLTITIHGNSTISLSSNGYILRIRDCQNIILKDTNLRGRLNNPRPIVFNGGNFTMQGSASVHGNTAPSGGMNFGNGVQVWDGTFTMQDNASVHNNNVGVSSSWSNNDVTFIMRDNASVHNNTTAGVRLYGGTFIMRDNASIHSNGLRGGATVSNGVSITGDATFTMQDNASVHGNTGGSSGVQVGGDSTFIMRDNASVSGNTNMRFGAVLAIGIFTMLGSASVHDNTGDGVQVGGVNDGTMMRGIFTMQDNASVHGNSGTGVRVWWASNNTFTMQDNASVHGNGGGVSIGSDSTFTMQDHASIHGNSGGGVSSRGTFTMRDNASIHNNIGWGGVRVSGSIFTMQDNASVHSNTATGTTWQDGGGGVQVSSGGGDNSNSTFIMRDNASIHGNIAYRGGGVHLWGSSSLVSIIFRISGGTIYGNNAVNGNALYANFWGSGSRILQHGTFSGNMFTSRGDFPWNVNNTIRVVNGVLQ